MAQAQLRIDGASCWVKTRSEPYLRSILELLIAAAS